MHAVAYLFRRKPGLTRPEFEEMYLSHGELVSKVAKGLISYRQYPTRALGAGDVSDSNNGDFDALSVYVFRSPEEAAETAQLPEILADSEAFIDFESMITLPVSPRRVV